MGRKGVILSGGRGKRLHPLTLVTSKQLLAVYDKPMIYYPLSVLMMAGITEIMIVSSSHDLYRFQSLFEDGSSLGIKMSYGVQEIPLGIAHAFLVAEGFIGDDNVALILGDNIYYGQQLEEMLKNMEIPNEGATIFAYQVSHPEKYGVVKFDHAGNVEEILEKPKDPPSNFAVTGLYFYDNQVIEIAKQLTPSARGEMEITDVNNAYLRKKQLHIEKLGKGFAWFDSGTFEDLHRASTYVQILQENHNTKIGCIEEVAYRMGYIDAKQLLKLADAYDKSDYGDYLRSLLT
jgi:glucose-1-phosphate thymidylyltransferase